jgi:hypothetical protein
MRKRFSTPHPLATSPDDTEDVAAPQDETTHRYTSHAIADIRNAIAQAKAVATEPSTAPKTVRTWSEDLPPMAATEDPGLAENTQRYADRSVAGIRAAIAAARAAAPDDGSTRAAARFALGETPAVKVPSMILETRGAAEAPASDHPNDDADEAP